MKVQKQTQKYVVVYRVDDFMSKPFMKLDFDSIRKHDELILRGAFRHKTKKEIMDTQVAEILTFKNCVMEDLEKQLMKEMRINKKLREALKKETETDILDKLGL